MRVKCNSAAVGQIPHFIVLLLFYYYCCCCSDSCCVTLIWCLWQLASCGLVTVRSSEKLKLCFTVFWLTITTVRQHNTPHTFMLSVLNLPQWASRVEPPLELKQSSLNKPQILYLLPPSVCITPLKQDSVISVCIRGRGWCFDQFWKILQIEHCTV